MNLYQVTCYFISVYISFYNKYTKKHNNDFYNYFQAC